MRKSLIFIIAVSLLFLMGSGANAQAPTTIMAGGLYQGGERSVGFWYGYSVTTIEDTTKRVKNILRTGYFYSNTTPDEIQAVSILTLIEKTLLDLRPGLSWYLSTGGGGFIEIKDGEDGTSFAILLETGVQLNTIVKFGLGIHYETIKRLDDRKLVYFIVNLFP